MLILHGSPVSIFFKKTIGPTCHILPFPPILSQISEAEATGGGERRARRVAKAAPLAHASPQPLLTILCYPELRLPPRAPLVLSAAPSSAHPLR